MTWIHPRDRRPEPGPVFQHKQWQRCYEHFLLHIENKSGSVKSRLNYDRICRAFFSDSGKTPDQYTQSDVRDFITRPTCGASPKHRGTAPKPGTYNARLNPIKSFYKFASTYDVPFRTTTRPLLRGNNPAAHVDAVKDECQSYKAMAPQDVHAFFAAIPRDTVQGMRNFAIFCCYFWTARRREEILQLRFGDIEPWTFDDGHQGWRYHFHGKGHSRLDDTAELLAPAKKAIDDYLMFSGRATYIKLGDPLFVGTVNCDPRKPVSGNTIDCHFRQYCRAAGLEDKGYSIHSFRWTAGWERYIRNGKDIIKIKELFRHSSIETTFRYLRHKEQLADSDGALLEAEFGNL